MENSARNEMVRNSKNPAPRPLTLARVRNALLVRTSEMGAIAVILNVLRATDPMARPATIHPDIEAASRQPFRGGVSRCEIVVPVFSLTARIPKRRELDEPLQTY